MPRRILLYLAVSSLAALGLASAASAVALWSVRDGYWTSYPPNPAAAPPSDIAVGVINYAGAAELILAPIAALATAAYLLVLDRAVRRSTGATRGFDVRPVERIH